MRQSRLFEMVYLLLDRPEVTAGELAKRFEVSVRTIYRDIEKLCEAGIPIYTERGRRGGIRLMDRFVLNKSLLTQQEQENILSAVQGLAVTHFPEAREMAEKLRTLFQDHNQNWIAVDLTDWKPESRERFELVKEAVRQSRAIRFDYYSAAGERTSREAEPIQLWYKGKAWYLLAYCTARGAERLFKLSRMRRIELTDRTFHRELPEIPPPMEEKAGTPMVRLRLRIDASESYRVYDEFEEDQILQSDGSGFLVEIEFSETDWVYGYLLSYGPHLEVLEPERVRVRIAQDLKKMLSRY